MHEERRYIDSDSRARLCRRAVASRPAERLATAARRLVPGGLRIVLYHHVTSVTTALEGELHVATRQDLFEAQIRKLATDYEIVDLDCVLSGRLPKRALLITFDDGYRSVLDAALPFLSRQGLPSVFFVSGAFLDRDSVPLENLLCWLASQRRPEVLAASLFGPAHGCYTTEALVGKVSLMPYQQRSGLHADLTEQYDIDARSLRTDSGLFLEAADLACIASLGCEVAAHTRSHIRCRTIPDEEVATLEIVSHQHDLEVWSGSRVRAFSYPYGEREDATPLVERVLAESGHEAAFLVESRFNGLRHGDRPWNRVSLHHEAPSMLAAELELLPHLRSLRDAFRAPR